MPTERVVIYFPWKEVSGGPIYLVKLAEELAENDRYSVYYVDYEDGYSNDLITSDKINKVTVSLDDYSIPFDEPITIILPIYFACWIPNINKESKILFVNWHICSIPTLQHNWQISNSNVNNFLELVKETNSVFFCDESHRLGQNTNNIIFDRNIVPITLSSDSVRESKELVVPNVFNMAVLGRLCRDKIYSVLNVLERLNSSHHRYKKIVHIIGDGPDKELINVDDYSNIEVIFVGTLPQKELREYLSTKCDCLFAMGTSVLEGAALALPTVIIPHNMKPIMCNSYVFVQNSTGYCLGWYDDQFDALELSPITMDQVLEDLSNKDLYRQLSEEAYDYYLNNHTIEKAIQAFSIAIDKTTLTYDHLVEKSLQYKNIAKKISFSSLVLLTFDRTISGVDARLFGRYKLFNLRNDVDPKWKIVNLLGFDLFRVSRGKRFYRISKVITREKLIYSPVVENNHKLTHESIQNIQIRLFEKLDRIHFDNIVEMDTCDQLLSNNSLNYFCSDIETEYLSLIRGLDEESITIINRVISRIQAYMKNRTSYFMMGDDELSEYRKMIEYHASKLVRLNDSTFAYGKYLIPIDIITSTVFYYDCFMPELILNYREREIIDAGGSFADSALILSDYTDKQVHVFEPTTQMYELAERTVKLNNLSDKIILNKLALGDEKISKEIRVAKDFSSLCFEEHSEQEKDIEIVNLDTLDSYVERKNIKVGVIKVDVEGYEEKLLDGALKTITRDKPALILSIYHSSEQFFLLKKKIEGLGLGYSFKIRKPLDRSIIVDTMLIAEVIN